MSLTYILSQLVQDIAMLTLSKDFFYLLINILSSTILLIFRYFFSAFLDWHISLISYFFQVNILYKLFVTIGTLNKTNLYIWILLLNLFMGNLRVAHYWMIEQLSWIIWTWFIGIKTFLRTFVRVHHRDWAKTCLCYSWNYLLDSYRFIVSFDLIIFIHNVLVILSFSNLQALVL